MLFLNNKLHAIQIKVVNTVLVLVVLDDMYRTGIYIGMKMLTFCTSLNIGRTGYVLAILTDFGLYRLVPGVPASKKKKKNFFFLIL